MHAVPNRKYRIGRSRAGLGLYATKPFRKREYIVTYRGRRLPNAEADRLEARGSRYMFEINTRWTIDGSKRWNVARYVNHSCRPNAEAIERRGPIIVYCARRKIKPGRRDHGRLRQGLLLGLHRQEPLPLRQMHGAARRGPGETARQDQACGAQARQKRAEPRRAERTAKRKR